MATVAIDDARDLVNVSSGEVPDVKVLRMTKRAKVTLEHETRKENDYDSCADPDC